MKTTTEIDIFQILDGLTLGDDWEESIREDAPDYFSEVIYYNDGLDVISKYEGEYSADAEDMVSDDKTYTAQDWSEAMMEWARALYYCAQSAAVEPQIDAIKEAVEDFTAEVEAHGGVAEDAKFSNDCLYGWEAHNYETEDGTMVWGARNPHGNFNYNPALLEGELVAVSRKVTDGVWLNLAWTPEAEEEENA